MEEAERVIKLMEKNQLLYIKLNKKLQDKHGMRDFENILKKEGIRVLEIQLYDEPVYCEPTALIKKDHIMPLELDDLT